VRPNFDSKFKISIHLFGLIILLSFFPLRLKAASETSAEGLPAHYKINANLDPIEHQKMLLLLQSKLTHFDSDGDGEVDVIRKYDKDGFNLKTIYFIDQTEDAQVQLERIKFEYNPIAQESSTWLLTRQEFLRFKQNIDNEHLLLSLGKIIHKESQMMHPLGYIQSRETTKWDDENKIFIKTQVNFYGTFYSEKFFHQTKNNWRLVSVQNFPRFLINPSELKNKLTSIGQQYVDCLAKKDPVGLHHCESVALTDPIAKFTELAPHFATLTCVQDETVFSPSGFRIDINSCSTPDSRQRLELASRKVTEEKMKCIAQINPNFARDCTKAFLLKRPKFICVQSKINSDGFDSYANLFCSSSNDKTNCREKIEKITKISSGFYDNVRPNEIYLTGIDPTVPNWTKHHSKVLETTIFHEMLHSCGHPGGKYHNHPQMDDDVYGCDALCGGNTATLSEEGCIACVTSSKKSEESKKAIKNDKEFCQQFPKEIVLRHLLQARLMEEAIKNCPNNALETKACLDKIQETIFKEHLSDLCGKKPKAEDFASLDWRQSCINKIRLKMAQEIREAGKVAQKTRPEDLMNAMAILALGSSNRFLTKRDKQGKLQREIGYRNSCSELKMIMKMVILSSMGFCQELQGLEKEKEIKKLRAEYEDDIRMLFKDEGLMRSLPIFTKKPHSLQELQEKCRELGSETNFSPGIQIIRTLENDITKCN